MRMLDEIEIAYKIISPAWLQRERLERGYSYREAAALLGCSASYLSDVEKERRQIRSDSQLGKDIMEMWGGVG